MRVNRDKTKESGSYHRRWRSCGGWIAKRNSLWRVSVLQDTPAWNEGIREGDIITSVNRKPVTNPGELMAAASQAGGSLLLNIIRPDGSLFVLIH